MNQEDADTPSPTLLCEQFKVKYTVGSVWDTEPNFPAKAMLGQWHYLQPQPTDGAHSDQNLKGVLQIL